MAQNGAKSEKVLVVSDNCGHCNGLKQELDRRGLLGKIKVLRYETPEGRQFCETNGITAVPECMVITSPDGKKARTCSPDEFIKLVEEGY